MKSFDQPLENRVPSRDLSVDSRGRYQNIFLPNMLPLFRAGNLPEIRLELSIMHRRLKRTFNENVKVVAPVLSSIKLTSEVSKKIINAEVDSWVMVDNDLMKAVLIRWDPGKESSIHGHPKGGCLFRVLQGSLLEKRYTADEDQQFLGKKVYRMDQKAYIDDLEGFHAVSNPFSVPAISLHIYAK